MAVVVNGIVLVDGMPVGKANGVKEGTIIDLTYPKVRKIIFDTDTISVL